MTALDASGNQATGYNGTVHFTSTDPAWFPAADVTLVNGFGFSDASFKTAGSQSVTATDTLVPSITGSVNFTVIPGTLNRLAVSGPSLVTAGVPFSVTVRSTDLFGNTIVSYTGTVHLSSTDAAGILPADSMLTNGVRVFSVTLKTVVPGNGTQTVSAVDSVDRRWLGSTA